jgi:hypothetical protein
MSDLERLRALEAELLAAEPDAPVPESWRADPASVRWLSPLGEDPRPDLPGGDTWTRLLQLASGDADDPQGTYGRLLAARACGALLEVRRGHWTIRPTLDPTERLSVWATVEDFNRDVATRIGPRSREILDLLHQLPVPVEVGE